MSEYRSRLAERIIRAREQRGWSRDQLAYRADVSVKQLERIEKAQSDPRLSTIRKLAAAMDLQVVDLRPDLQQEEEQIDRIEFAVNALIAQATAQSPEEIAEAAVLLLEAKRRAAARNEPPQKEQGREG